MFIFSPKLSLAGKPPNNSIDYKNNKSELNNNFEDIFQDVDIKIQVKMYLNSDVDV